MHSSGKRNAKEGAGSETVVWKIPSPLKDGTKIPAVAFVRNDGRFVVLRDQYLRIGCGTVLAFLGPQGQTLQMYTLDDLFSLSEVLNMVHTVSSIWWTSGLFRFTDTGDRFGYITDQGSVGVFDLATGKRLLLSKPETVAFREEARRIERHDLSGATDSDSGRGVILAGVLQDRESVSVLTLLLTDPSHCQRITGGRNGRQDDYFGMQLQAGTALVHILGTKAAPLLETRLAKANPTMQTEWIGLIAKTGTATHSAAVLRCVQSRLPDVRYAAITALTQNGGIPFVHKHPAWLSDRSENIRYLAVHCLAESGDSRDLPSLVHATTDSDEIVRLWGLRGMIRLNPSNLNSVLHRYIGTYPNESEARLALADRGDVEQLHWCLNVVSRFTETWRRKHDTASVRIGKSNFGASGLQDIAKILAHRRPAGTQDALKRITELPGNLYDSKEFFECAGFGGLATMGDSKALQRVRDLTSLKDPFTSCNAIEWLVICRDRSSLPLLRSLLQDREAMIRDAARKALVAIGGTEI
jgi:hypothetical protein